MNVVRSMGRQRGVSAWTLAGSVFLVAGVAGLGAALIKPGSAPSSVASVSTAGADKAAAAGALPSPIARAANPGSGPHPNWRGTWRAAGSDAKLVITADGVGECKWIDATEPRFASACESGYAKASVSQAEISRQYEAAVAMFQRDPSDFKISDPVQSRQMIGRIKPGNYRKIWMQDGSDCGGSEMIIDGDLLLQMGVCKYGHRVSLFTRDGAAPLAVGQVPAVAANTGAMAPQASGRWQGDVTQPGYPSYPAVLQLQSNAAGAPAGTMAYPSLGCTATLTFLRASGSAMLFTESILEGKGKCQDGGQISIAPMGNELIWKYLVPGNTGAAVASATLRR